MTSTAVHDYNFHGDGIAIRVHVRPTNKVTLDYNGTKFSGRTLSRQKTKLGLTLYATIETVPDSHTVVLAVFVPEAHLPEPAESMRLETFGVFATLRTSISGPSGVTGQLQTYKVVQLQGSGW